MVPNEVKLNDINDIKGYDMQFDDFLSHLLVVSIINEYTW